MNDISKFIDHTILKPDANKEMIKKLCEEAKEYKFASVCVNPYYVKYVRDQLSGTDIKVTSVVGFPLGCTLKEVKSFEAKKAVEDGADEIDMVINISALKDGDYDIVKEDIKAVVETVKNKAIVKVIIETCLLTKEEKIKSCEIAKNCGADFVKTSTGFSTSGATESDIKLMRTVVGNEIGVKASGGVRTLKHAKQMIDAGATRIGASSSVDIVKGI